VPRLARFPEITTLPDAGHYPHIEAPERVAASIGAFVDANAGGARSAVLTSG
jgi:pimeloyl-ACP methyl ester carboxylesterase